MKQNRTDLTCNKERVDSIMRSQSRNFNHAGSLSIESEFMSGGILMHIRWSGIISQSTTILGYSGAYAGKGIVHGMN